jgi:phosphopantetheinyl transferase
VNPVQAWVLPSSVTVDEGCLAASERARAAGMGAPAVAARHRRGRAALRHAVAAGTGMDPCAVALTLTAAGHPVVDAPGGPWVSVAHSDDVVAVATCADAPVGIDVEVPPARCRPVPKAVATAERQSAVAHLVAAPLRPFAVWVVLEAALKAAGTGFAQEYRAARWTAVDGGVLVDLPVGGCHGCRLRLDGDVIVAVARQGRLVPTVRWRGSSSFATVARQQSAGGPSPADR